MAQLIKQYSAHKAKFLKKFDGVKHVLGHIEECRLYGIIEGLGWAVSTKS